MKKRKFLLPVAVTVTFLVAFLGMRVPNYAKPLKSKSSTRAVLEVQAKETKEGLNKTYQAVALHAIISSFAPTTFSFDAFHHETHSNTSTLVSSAPARASPAVHS